VQNEILLKRITNFPLIEGTTMKKMINMKSGLSVLLFLMLSFAVCAQETEVAKALQPFVDSGEMPGFVTLLATKDKILQINSVGYADVVAKTPMKENTIFWIASSSKPFAAAAVMILVDEGKINLDESIATYLPEFHDLKVAVKNDEAAHSPAMSVSYRRLDVSFAVHGTFWN
jgi:CubicO group peptidase (beta-lactamase class C family)